MASDLYPRQSGPFDQADSWSENSVAGNRAAQPYTGGMASNITFHMDDDMGAGAIDFTLGSDMLTGLLGMVDDGFTGTLTLNADLKISGNVAYSGVIAGAGDLTATGNCDVTGWTVTTWTGALILAGTGTISMTSSGSSTNIIRHLHCAAAAKTTTLATVVWTRKVTLTDPTGAVDGVWPLYVVPTAASPIVSNGASMNLAGTLILYYSGGNLSQGAFSFAAGSTGKVVLRNNTGQTFSLSGNWDLGGCRLTIGAKSDGAGTLDMAGYNLTVGDDIGFSISAARAGVLYCGEGVLTVGANIEADNIAANIIHFEDVTIYCGGTINGANITSDAVDANVYGEAGGSCTITGLTVDSGTLTCHAPRTVNGGSNATVGTTILFPVAGAGSGSDMSLMGVG